MSEFYDLDSALAEIEPSLRLEALRWARNVLRPIPEGAMRVAPGSDAVVWRVNSDKCGEL